MYPSVRGDLQIPPVRGSGLRNFQVGEGEEATVSFITCWRAFHLTRVPGPVIAGDLSRQPSLLSQKPLPERQPAGPFEKRSCVNPFKVSERLAEQGPYHQSEFDTMVCGTCPRTCDRRGRDPSHQSKILKPSKWTSINFQANSENLIRNSTRNRLQPPAGLSSADCDTQVEALRPFSLSPSMVLRP